MDTNLKKEFEFNLTIPISYKPSSSGDQEEAFKLILKAPTNKQRTQRIKLKEYVKQANDYSDRATIKSMDAESLQALVKIGEQENRGSTKEETPEDIQKYGVIMVNNLYSCPEIKMTAVIEEFLSLLKEVCLVENDVKLTSPLFDKMDPDDTDRLLGEYLVNFINGS